MSAALQAKNLIDSSGVPTLVAKAVEVLQEEVPNAAVLYCTTGISGAHRICLTRAVHGRLLITGARLALCSRPCLHVACV